MEANSLLVSPEFDDTDGLCPVSESQWQEPNYHPALGHRQGCVTQTAPSIGANGTPLPSTTINSTHVSHLIQ